MRKRGRGGDGESGDHGENGGKSNGGDEGEEDISGNRLGQQRSTHVGAAVLRDEVTAYDGRGSEAEKGGHDVEAADNDHRPDDGETRGLGIGNRVEADQDVGQVRRFRE